MLIRREGFDRADRRASLARRMEAVAEIRRREQPRLPPLPQAYGELRLVRPDQTSHGQDAA